jgi:hypothetical protein
LLADLDGLPISDILLIWINAARAGSVLIARRLSGAGGAIKAAALRSWLPTSFFATPSCCVTL